MLKPKVKKIAPYVQLHPEGHYRGKELKEFKRQQKHNKAANDALYILERAGLRVDVKSQKNGDLIFKVKS